MHVILTGNATDQSEAFQLSIPTVVATKMMQVRTTDLTLLRRLGLKGRGDDGRIEEEEDSFVSFRCMY